MRHWSLSAHTPGRRASQALAGLVGHLGSRDFGSGFLEDLQPLLPAASFSVYRTGQGCRPQLFLSGSRGVPDTTLRCWQAYLSGPYLQDATLPLHAGGPLLCHMVAHEAPPLHRRKVYEAHGVAERVSVVDSAGPGVFAVNLYRHEGQHAFSDGQIGDFEQLAPVLLSLVRKHLALRPESGPGTPNPHGTEAEGAALTHRRQRLQQLAPGLTERELDVCARLLLGMSQEGIAQDLALGLPTVKTYRNRAFQRLGIHFRSQLFAKALGQDLGP